MSNFKNSRTFLAILSVLCAILLWLYVENIDPTIKTLTVHSIPVEFVGEDALMERGLMISEGGDADIDLTVSGQRGIIAALGNGKEIRIRADLSGITSTGPYSLTYEVIYPDSIHERDVEEVSASAYRITVNVVELYKKSISVRGERTGTPAEGYMAGEMAFDADTVEISGEQVAVSNISHAQVTVDLSGASSTIEESVSFQLIDFNGEVVDASDIRCNVDTVRVTVPILMVKELELDLDFLETPGSTADDIVYTISPSTVTVAGEEEILAGLEKILLQRVNISSLTQDVTYTVPIPIPSGATNLSGQTSAQVIINFVGVETRSFTTTAISYIHAPEGHHVSVVTQEVDVTLRGPAEELDALTDVNIRVVGDLSDVSATNGNYAVPATVYVDGAENTGAVGPYQITVQISSQR